MVGSVSLVHARSRSPEPGLRLDELRIRAEATGIVRPHPRDVASTVHLPLLECSRLRGWEVRCRSVAGRANYCGVSRPVAGRALACGQ